MLETGTSFWSRFVHQSLIPMWTARELTLEAAQSAASNKLAPPNYASHGYSASHIKKLLDSRNEREVLDGMRRVISVRNAHPLFSEGPG